MIPFAHYVIFFISELKLFFFFFYHLCTSLTPDFHCFSGPSTSEGDVFDLKVTAELNAFNIFVCDQKSNIADIKIHGNYPSLVFWKVEWIRLY